MMSLVIFKNNAIQNASFLYHYFLGEGLPNNGKIISICALRY
jgi:hypothetical protein